MRRGGPRLMWLAFAAAAAVVLAAMAWTTRAVLRLDRAEADSRRRAQLEENVRLALWRMDSALAPLIAAEHARPAAAYSGDSPAGPLASPPLPGTDRPFVRVYFEFAGDGPPRIASRAAPQDADRLARVVPLALLDDALPPAPAAPEPEALAQAPNRGVKGRRPDQEYQARAQNTSQQVQVQAAMNAIAGAAAPAPSVMRPVWAGDDLVLARRVGAGPGARVQGGWVDWASVRSWLLESVKDLLPEARLEPVEVPAAGGDARLLASLPARLIPGDVAAASPVAGFHTSPLRTSLAVAWACVLLAIAAVALLLRGVVALSERRASFVSAVTHELRTPLTTLRMYTEMLEGGMVEGAERRQDYLSTLRAEADRLGHLVENVLAYSRLERNRAGYEPTVVKLGDVLPRTIARLSERAKHAGMELVADVPPEAAAANVRTNALALEQILFNLVDNACKYAAAAEDKRIELSARVDGSRIAIRVCDHGPGLAKPQAANLFQPFSKSAQEAANTAPGLGLGLSLSRRLARSMGGDLWLDVTPPAEHGARFVFTLPRA